MVYLTTTISIVSITIAVVTFIINRHKDTKMDASNSSYKQGQLDEKLKNILEKLDQIEKKLDLYDTEIDQRIEKAIEEHIAIYHKDDN